MLLILFPDSKKIFVTSQFCNFIAIFLFASCCFGKNPLKENLSDGKPERINALITADGPGRTVKEMPSLIHLCVSGYPGSDISGAPASDKSATVSPLLMSLIISSVASFSLCS